MQIQYVFLLKQTNCVFGPSFGKKFVNCNIQYDKVLQHKF